MGAMGRFKEACLALLAGLAVANAVLCRPEWAKRDGDDHCPYGTRLSGDVTKPNDADFGEWLCVIWSFIPFAWVGVVAVMLCIRRGTTELLMLIFPAIQVAFNEVCVKQLVKQQRPEGSCCLTCGMPSSHATMSAGYIVWLLLEILVHTPADAAVSSEDAAANLEAGLAEPEPKTIGPCSAHKIGAAFVVLSCFLPVMPCRHVLKDHSADQIAVGAAVGFVEAVVWFFVLRQFIHPCLPAVHNSDTCGGCCIKIGCVNNWPNMKPEEQKLANFKEPLLASSGEGDDFGGALRGMGPLS